MKSSIHELFFYRLHCGLNDEEAHAEKVQWQQASYRHQRVEDTHARANLRSWDTLLCRLSSSRSSADIRAGT